MRFIYFHQTKISPCEFLCRSKLFCRKRQNGGQILKNKFFVRLHARRIISVLLALTLLLAPVSGAATVYAEPAQGNIKDTISQILTKVGPSVVGIIGRVNQDKYSSTYGQYTPFGTGVIFRSDGYIITNSHVVADMSDIVVVLSDGKAYKADLKLNDEKTDLAIIKIGKTGLVPAEFGNDEDISVGETVIAIGTPMSFSLRNSATMGIISGLNRSASGDYKFIQSDVAINGGNSGGPLVNTSSKIIGINSVKMTGVGVEGLSFSIPVNTIKYIISQYEKFGRVKRPYLGAKLAEGVAATYGLPSNEGLTITELEKDSPAQKSGLAIDDIVTAINGVKLTSMVDFNEEGKKYLPGDTVDLTVERNDAVISVKVTFGEAPDSSKAAAAASGSQSEGYSVGPDGSLNDLSFLVGGIGNTKIGHSFYGWSINVPKASQIISQSFNSRNLVISNQSRKLIIIINANQQKQGWDLNRYYDYIKDQKNYYGKVIDSGIHDTAAAAPGTTGLKYAELLYKMDRSGSAVRRIYVANGYIYSVAFISEDNNPTSFKADEYYQNLMNSFRLDYKGGTGEIKDLSKVVNGQTEYTNYASISTYDKLETWKMSFKPDWKLLPGGAGQFTTSFGANEKELMEVAISSFGDGQDLTSYCQQLKQDYAAQYNPDSYNLLEQKALEIGGNKAYKLVYMLKIGKTKYVYDDNYIAQNGLVYRVRIKTTFDRYNASKENYYKMLNTFKPATADIDSLKKAIEDSEMNSNSNSIGKGSAMTDYENKKQKWSIKVPGDWVKRSVYYSASTFEGLFDPDNQTGIYVNSYDNSRQKADNKYNVDDKNVMALVFLEAVINDTYKDDSYYDDEYMYDSDPYSVFDTVVSEDDYSTENSDDIIDDSLSDLLDKYDGVAGESGSEIKQRQLDANTAAGKKFSAKTVLKDKNTTVTAYTYKYTDESAEISSDIQIYILEKDKNIYYYASILPTYLSSAKNTKLLKDIWASFKLQ